MGRQPPEPQAVPDVFVQPGTVQVTSELASGFLQVSTPRTGCWQAQGKIFLQALISISAAGPVPLTSATSALPCEKSARWHPWRDFQTADGRSWHGRTPQCSVGLESS